MVFLLKAYLAKKNWNFQVVFDVSSPRRTSIRLGEGVNLRREDQFFA